MSTSTLVQFMVAGSATYSFITPAWRPLRERLIISSTHIRRVVLLTSVMSPGAYLIQHFTHRHPMKMLKVADVMYVEKYFALITHFINVPSPSIITTAPNGCRNCDEECLGFSFCCEKCNFYLDGKCAFLPTANSKNAEEIQHFTHQPPLRLQPGSMQSMRGKLDGHNSGTHFRLHQKQLLFYIDHVPSN
ncbi:hypothetical protein V6N13_073412 [Hibiscus sabdariffa]|uniref:Uncharacterized protein n=1 Tax=Hibiscus sabdariffa TaxID=183260 RepID=A0ABR2BEQ2_9ROSI